MIRGFLKLTNNVLMLALTGAGLSACVGSDVADNLSGANKVPNVATPTPVPVRPIVLAASSTINFATVTLGSMVTQTVTFVNAGSDIANLASMTFTASSGSLTAISKSNDTCSGNVLLVGSSCSVDITFNPASTGAYIGFASLNYVSPSLSSYNVSLPYTGSATIVQPVVISSPSTWDFGSVPTNTSNIKTLTISNNASGVAQFQAATISGTGYSISTDACNTVTLTASTGTCSITIGFNTATTGSVLGTLTLNYRNSAGTSMTTIVSLSGIGIIPPPDVQSNPASWDFGTVTTSATPSKTLIISNTSTGSAVFSPASIAGAGYTITSDGCNGLTKNNSNGTCNVVIQFSPTIPGSSLGQLTLNYTPSGGSATTKVVSLSGIGNVPQPVLTLSPNPYNFGNVATNTYATQIITVSNNTSVSATIGTASVSGSGYTITSNSCNSTVLGAAANCTIAVRFTPTGLGASAGTLTVPFSSAQGINYSATDTLGGTGVTPSTSFSFAGATGSSNLTATGVTINWTAQTLASYYIASWTTGGTTLTSSHIAPTTLNSYNVTGLAANTTYLLKVNAYDALDTSDGNANTVSVTTPNVTGATFNGWSDVVAHGSVFTDVGLLDTSLGNTGANRIERNLSAVYAFDNTGVNTGTSVITVGVSVTTGTKVIFQTDGTAPTGLTPGGTYFVINASATTLKLASSYANALASTAITLSAAGSGNMTLMPQGMVKLGWELFTFTPSGTATSYNIYRDTTAGFTSPTLIGTSATQSFVDYQVSDQTNYYYKVFPVISGVEVPAAAVNDSIIQITVPPPNMTLLHRWIINREACTNLLGFAWPAGVNRNTNYSCAYTWGTGYAPSTTYDKTKWDVGYSMVVDRWQSGCKIGAWAGSTGTAVPAAGLGSSGNVYYRKGTAQANQGFSACYYKDASLGWLVESSGSLTNAQRSAMRTNYPGYAPGAVTQAQAYSSCQQRVVSGVVDGNGNTRMRTPRIYEYVLARAQQGTNVNNRAAATLNNIQLGVDLPNNGSCNVISGANGSVYLHGVSLPHPGAYPTQYYGTANGSNLTRNCYSRYEVADLWSVTYEWTPSQYTQTAAGNGAFVTSSLDAGDNLVEGFKMDGVMGTATAWGTWANLFGTSTTMLPLFGIHAQAVSTTLGTRTISYTEYGQAMGMPTWPSLAVLGVGAMGYANSGYGGRYHFKVANPSGTAEPIYGNNQMNFRCTGQVGP